MEVNRYELIMVAPGDYDEATANDIFEEYKKEIKPAKIISAESWGNKRLAYPIGKQKKGWFYLFDFYATPETLDRIKLRIAHDASIIKHIHVIKEHGKLTELEDKSELLEESVQVEAKSEQDLYPNVKPKPVDVFDLIFNIKEE